MTTYERIISELGDGLGIDLAPDGSGVTEVCAEDRIVLLRADETGERELTVFTVAMAFPFLWMISSALKTKAARWPACTWASSPTR